MRPRFWEVGISRGPKRGFGQGVRLTEPATDFVA